MTRGAGSLATVGIIILGIAGAMFPTGQPVHAADFDTKIFRAAAIGLAVDAVSPSLNKFINTFTFNNKIPVGMSTKVVPILSVGEKGYAGAAQVAGPQSLVKTVKSVWAYEDNFSGNEFRLKVLVPSSSLNPFGLKRVQKVGVSAVVDVSLDGRWKGQTFSRSVGVGEILKAGAVALAVKAAAGPLNNAINAVSGGSSASTKVVPIATIGDKAYIGGAQVSGSSTAIKSVKVVYQYEEIFDGGKFRIKALVPSNSSSPLSIKRVGGAGITALIDTSIADQERIREREWRDHRVRYAPIDVAVRNRFDDGRHDRGRHLGWYIGKGNQRKRLAGVWTERYIALSPEDRYKFEEWYHKRHKDNPEQLEKRWQEWLRERQGHRVQVVSPVREQDRDRDQDQDRDRDKAKAKEKAKKKSKAKSKSKGKGKH